MGGSSLNPKDEMKPNNRLQATTHKLSLCTTFRSLLDYRVQPVGRRLNRDVGCKTII